MLSQPVRSVMRRAHAPSNRTDEILGAFSRVREPGTDGKLAGIL
jgi:hypothetical protein